MLQEVQGCHEVAVLCETNVWLLYAFSGLTWSERLGGLKGAKKELSRME